MQILGFDPHDHGQCITTGVAAADAACRARGVRLTPVRKRVLEILLAEHRAMGAYDVLEVLRAEGLGSQPPVVYRALGFLVDQGFAHKVERLNAFIACAHASQSESVTAEAGQAHRPVFLICEGCGVVAETAAPEAGAALDATAKALGFTISTAMVEVLGQCPRCAAAA
ncbi:MAG: transcriptional repressor [Primorskyibacter sp.]